MESQLGIQLRITQGYRSVAEQNALYAKGRTTPGSIVTNAKGGESYHNYGLAFDVGPIVNGKLNYNVNWNKIGALGVQFGFSPSLVFFTNEFPLSAYHPLNPCLTAFVGVVQEV